MPRDRVSADSVKRRMRPRCWLDQAIEEHKILLNIDICKVCCMPSKENDCFLYNQITTLPYAHSISTFGPFRASSWNPPARKKKQPFFSGEEGRPPQPPYSSQMGRCEWPHESALEIRRSQKRQANIATFPLAPGKKKSGSRNDVVIHQLLFFARQPSAQAAYLAALSRALCMSQTTKARVWQAHGHYHVLSSRLARNKRIVRSEVIV